MRASLKIACCILLMLRSPVAFGETISVEQIIQLSNIQIGDDAIIAKINKAESVFNLSTDEMIDLKRKGVSSKVIAAMLDKRLPQASSIVSNDSPDPEILHPSGLYILENQPDSPKMERMDPLSANQIKTGGIIGYALTSGIASMSIKVAIPNESAKIKANANPVFYFFFDSSQPNGTNGSFLGSTFGASSPGEFSLVVLTSKGDRREARVGSMNITGTKMGVMDKDRVTFDYTTVRPGVYKVTVSHPLMPGEYGFLYSISGASVRGATDSRIFDFSVN